MTDSKQTAFASIRSLGRQLRAGETTSVELTRLCLDRLEQIGSKLNAVVTVVREHALAEAERADRELADGKDRGPLHGIPYGAKDLLATKGLPTSWGAAPFQDQMIDVDATVVVRLREAGAVLAAKLAMVEIAGGLGYRQANASFSGPAGNPWNPDHWAGGSSTGPGAAVGGGLVPFAIGTETWGSIMTPAAYCAVSGLRPTYGRVSRHGAMALTWTLDKIGPMCRSADDCGLVLQAIAGADPADPSAADRPYRYPDPTPAQPPFKLAVLDEATGSVQPEVKANFEKSLDVLKEFATIETIELPDLPYSTVAGTILSSEIAAAFEESVSSGDIWEMTAPEDRWGVHATLLIPAKDYINAMRIRVHIQRTLDEVMACYDAVVVPTRSTVAPPNDRPFRDYYGGFHGTRIGGAGNAAGLPALSVPNGFGEFQLPTGVEFVGRAFEENRLIAVANHYQSATDWHQRHPDL